MTAEVRLKVTAKAHVPAVGAVEACGAHTLLDAVDGLAAAAVVGRVAVAGAGGDGEVAAPPGGELATLGVGWGGRL